MHVPASFSALHLHSLSTREASYEPLEHVTWNCPVNHGTPLPVASEGTPTGVLRSFYREGTSLHRPLGASLWFVTPTSLRFCVMEPLNFDLGSTGTFTCSVPSSGQMYLITESMFFSSSGVPNMLKLTRTTGLDFFQSEPSFITALIPLPCCLFRSAACGRLRLARVRVSVTSVAEMERCRACTTSFSRLTILANNSSGSIGLASTSPPSLWMTYSEYSIGEDMSCCRGSTWSNHLLRYHAPSTRVVVSWTCACNTSKTTQDVTHSIHG